jgi:hypothetical protein
MQCKMMRRISDGHTVSCVSDDVAPDARVARQSCCARQQRQQRQAAARWCRLRAMRISVCANNGKPSACSPCMPSACSPPGARPVLRVQRMWYGRRARTTSRPPAVMHNGCVARPSVSRRHAPRAPRTSLATIQARTILRAACGVGGARWRQICGPSLVQPARKQRSEGAFLDSRATRLASLSGLGLRTGDSGMGDECTRSCAVEAPVLLSTACLRV